MDRPVKEEKLFAEKTRNLSESTIFGSMATLMNALIMVIVLWRVVDPNRLLLWFALIVLFSLPRLYLYKTYPKLGGSLASLN